MQIETHKLQEEQGATAYSFGLYYKIAVHKIPTSPNMIGRINMMRRFRWTSFTTGWIHPRQASTTMTEAAVDRRALARNTKPIPCYAVEQIPPKQGGEALYTSLSTAVADNKAKLVDEVEIPPQDARSWVVKAGQMWRIVCHKGPQVADMNCWSLENPSEHFYTSKTRQIHATHLTTGDRLWSNMPYLRPLATITHDTIAYGFDDDGAGVHDVIGSRCDPYTNKLMTGEESHVCCHSNLTRQCMRDGLSEGHVHDVLNVFMCTGFTLDTHQYFTKPVGLSTLPI